jgi:outer membrane protein assembly factor BamA
MRALVIAALIACGGGGAKPTAPTPVEKPAPKPDVVPTAELTGAVKQVRVDGGGSMRGAIETAMAGLAGKPLDTDQVRAALTNVMATPGVADVTVKGVQLADGIELVVEVTLHPVMKTLTATEGAKTIALGMQAIPTGTPLDPKKVQALAASLRDRYVSNGYFDADVTWRRVAVAGGVDVVIDVKPGEASSIASIGFKGNTMPSKELAAQLTKLLVVGQPVLEE